MMMMMMMMMMMRMMVVMMMMISIMSDICDLVSCQCVPVLMPVFSFKVEVTQEQDRTGSNSWA